MANASYPSVLGQTIQTAEVDDVAITTAKIAAKAVTGAKLADGTANKLMGFDAAGVYAEITKSAYEIIEDYEVTGSAVASKTFTFTAIDFEDVSELVLIIDGALSGANMVYFRLNGGSDSTYDDIGTRNSGTVETLLSTLNAAQGTIATTTMTGTNWGFFARLHIGLTKAASSQYPHGFSEAFSIFTGIKEERAHAYGTVAASISSITILSGGANYNVGTRMTLYKVKRN